MSNQTADAFTFPHFGITPKPNKTALLLAERDRLIARNMVKPDKRNETRIWNINLELASIPLK